MRNILVTGGAGYIGSVLVPLLLNRGYNVRVLDNLMYGGRALLPCFAHKEFEFMRGDVRKIEDLRTAIEGMDAIYHLAAIVGFPACKKFPKLAEEVNQESTILLEGLRHDRPMFYASTGSNYGAIVGDVCTEETPLNPLTIYGTTKTEAEKYLLNRGNVVAYRYATAFGVAPRLRLDLLINDFAYQAVKNRNLIIYEKTFKRTFIHVRDIAKSLVYALENFNTMRDEVYNVGSNDMNFSKEDVALMIKRRIEYYLHFAEIGKDEDQRNYEVTYEKINKAGFQTTISIDEGIDELLKVMDVIDVVNEYSNV
ncbi:epimerase [candidate division LCP-89 bacterium B3_LCP]|uniref:Epimerase n=1 Tax=candidate division LCP-89 bacterium B3_LCP TaxID=2012998 RepID=A0A532UUJ4_UNCL8|nr:MAG: epimerase [candidate division LCP-89 bacterium B3_LCP]